MKIRNRDLLSHTTVASPCPASWEATRDCPVKMSLQKIRSYKTCIKLIATGASVLSMASPAAAQNAGPQPQRSPAKAAPEFVVTPKTITLPELNNSKATQPDNYVAGCQLGSDYGPYMKVLNTEIRKNWHPNDALAAKYKGPKVMFSISQDRSITNVKLLVSSGNANLDKQALDCFAKLKKMPIPLPDGSDDKIDVEFTFDYKLLKQIQAEK